MLAGCSDRVAQTDPISATPQFAAAQQGVEAAIAAQERHTQALMRIPGVVGTAVTRLPGGQYAVRLFLENGNVAGLPSALDGVPVAPLVTGRFDIISTPTTRARPAPLGFSVGHPSITAGTIGFRVLKGGSVYILSNNHVLANSNKASIGDQTLQPGPYDGGSAPNDVIGTLAQFRTIVFNSSNNTMDAAIAVVPNPADLDNKTPLDDGYGQPNATIWGDANNDGAFDNVASLLGVGVQKYGRTTEHTTGTITAINATVTVCYGGVIICTKAATFTDQLIVGQSGFSAGGDSGSGVVTNDANRQPVGLLFAGSATQTILNRIDLVLDEFDVTVDGFTSAPPAGVTDVEVFSVSAPGSATAGDDVSVTVTVRNIGTTPVGAFNVSLAEGGVGAIGSPQGVSGLAAGASAARTFTWTPTVTGTRTLTGGHDLSDDVAANDTKSTSVSVSAAQTGETHVGDLSGAGVAGKGGNWRADVTIAVHDAAHAAVAGVTVTGSWSGGTSGTGSCVTGVAGTCTVTSANINKKQTSATFTVTGISGGGAYVPANNHETSIALSKP